MSENHIRQFIAMCPPDSRPILSCKLDSDWEFLYIMIPLWFNIIWSYLIISDRCLAVCTRTLWRGCKEAICFDNDSIESISFNKTKAFVGSSYNLTIVVFGAEEAVEIKINKATYLFLVEHASRVQQFYPNTSVSGD